VQVFQPSIHSGKKSGFYGSIEFLLSSYEIRDRCLKEATKCLSPRTAPALCDSAVITFRELSHRGSQSGGGKTQMNVQVFKNISTELILHHQMLFAAWQTM
jgi:hypothetical protein